MALKDYDKNAPKVIKLRLSKNQVSEYVKSKTHKKFKIQIPCNSLAEILKLKDVLVEHFEGELVITDEEAGGAPVMVCSRDAGDNVFVY